MTTKDFLDKLAAKSLPEALEGKDGKINFDVSGDGGGAYTVVIENGTMRIEEGLADDPTCGIKGDSATMTGMVDGSVNPMMAIMMGKIKIQNQGEMMKYAKVLGLM